MKKNYKLKIPKQSLLLIFTGFSFFGCNQTENFIDLNNNSKMDPYEDPNISAIERAKDIISHLTIEEKIAQMESGAPSIPKLGISKYNWMNEALHGIRGDHGEITTVFPQAIGLAASWNVDLASQQGVAISDEARGLANDRGNDRYLDFWSPVITVSYTHLTLPTKRIV